MGRLLLVSRLVIGDIKRRRVQSALLLVMIVTTTTTLDARAGAPRRRRQPVRAHARRDARAPTSSATFGPGSGLDAGPRQFSALRHAPGVAATGGPYPVAFARLSGAGRISVPSKPRVATARRPRSTSRSSTAGTG